MKIRSRKGTAIVEASILFPLVIAAVMAVIYIVISFYSSLSLQASLHLALRKECGEAAQTVSRSEQYQSFEFKKEKVGLQSAICMEEERNYQINGIFAKRISKKEEGRSYVLDEAEQIRIFTMAGEVF